MAKKAVYKKSQMGLERSCDKDAYLKWDRIVKQKLRLKYVDTDLQNYAPFWYSLKLVMAYQGVDSCIHKLNFIGSNYIGTL